MHVTTAKTSMSVYDLFNKIKPRGVAVAWILLLGLMETMMRLEAEWKPDCQGKQDYDADLVRLSTRYWPRGGGFLTFDTGTREWAGNEARPEIKPSARATIYLQDEELASATFEGETEAEVKAQVEAWAQQQFDNIASALRNAFQPNSGAKP